MKTKVRFAVLAVILCLIPAFVANCQVSVNATGEPPDNSAMLDVKSTDRGLLIPRMTSDQIESIKDPADGLLVYCTSTGKVYLFVGATGHWTELDFGSGTITPWECGLPFTINHTVSGGVAPVDKTVTYGTVTNLPGEATKCWITSNLGADHQAVSVTDITEPSAGWYWQFNRKQGFKHDGTTLTPSWTITSINENLDWQAANDPCTIELGSGWRLPTLTEWVNVDSEGGWTTWDGPWNSGLKMHAAGYLGWGNGALKGRPTDITPYLQAGYYWSSSQSTRTPLYALGCFLNLGIDRSGSDDGWYKAHGFSVRCINDMETPGSPEATTASANHVTQTSAMCGGEVTSEGSSAVTARGVCWSTSPNPKASGSHTSDGSGAGAFTSNITGLTANTLYYVRAYAVNSSGTAYGNEIPLSTYNCGYVSVNHTSGDIAPVTKSVTYETVTNIPGETSKCWITSNLGADHPAASETDDTEPSAGWYWQFNRKQGYKAEGSTVTPAWTVTTIDEDSGWTSENDPCRLSLGGTWRIPTHTELMNVDMTWNTFADPWNSALKLHAAGYITTSGTPWQKGAYGRYWSSTQLNATDGYDLCFLTDYSNTENLGKVVATTLRCIKE